MKKKILLAVAACFVMLGIFAAAPAKTEAAASAADYRAVWFSYYDYTDYLNSTSKNNSSNFTTYFDNVLKRVKNRGLNRIIVQVRPCSDAMYDSSYFPTSAYIAGTQGKSISYDPLKIMVKEAHKKGIKIEAWINPYRVSFSTDYSKLSKDNPARKWHESSKASERRNVLSYNGQLYYNPSSEDVKQLIVNGVKEIVKNYDVDGIHMDDYFYPSFSASNYKTAFDAQEYNASQEKKDGMSIKKYRRRQVNKLVKRIKRAVKSIDSSVVFGISPSGNIDNLNSKYSNYVNIKKWTNSTKFVDYIAPQVYWGFNHKTAQFDKVVDRWCKMVDQSKVKLYIGLPAYKMGSSSAGTTSAEKKELTGYKLLRKQAKYAIKKKTNGIIVFDYSDLTKKASKKLGKYLKKTYT